jgi:predicted ATPase with chaperone activity
MAFRVPYWCHLKWNPHPCGFYGDLKRQCRCSSRQIENYRQRISGPLLDRIDLHVEVPLVDFRELTGNAPTGDKSATIRERVMQARRIQGERFRKSANATNETFPVIQPVAVIRIGMDLLVLLLPDRPALGTAGIA